MVYNALVAKHGKALARAIIADRANALFRVLKYPVRIYADNAEVDSDATTEANSDIENYEHQQKNKDCTKLKP